MAKEPRPPNGDSPYVAFAKYTGIGFEVAIAIVLSIYAGAYLDRRFGSSPLFLIICLILGFAAAINILLKYSRQARQDMKGGDDKGDTEQ